MSLERRLAAEKRQLLGSLDLEFCWDLEKHPRRRRREERSEETQLEAGSLQSMCSPSNRKTIVSTIVLCG